MTKEKRRKLEAWAAAPPCGPCPSRLVTLEEWAAKEAERLSIGGHPDREYFRASQVALDKARAELKELLGEK